MQAGGVHAHLRARTPVQVENSYRIQSPPRGGAAQPFLTLAKSEASCDSGGIEKNPSPVIHAYSRATRGRIPMDARHTFTVIDQARAALQCKGPFLGSKLLASEQFGAPGADHEDTSEEARGAHGGTDHPPFITLVAHGLAVRIKIAPVDGGPTMRSVHQLTDRKHGSWLFQIICSNYKTQAGLRWVATQLKDRVGDLPILQAPCHQDPARVGEC